MYGLVLLNFVGAARASAAPSSFAMQRYVKPPNAGAVGQFGASGASVAGVEVSDGAASVSFDTAPPVDVPTGAARVARRLAIINVSPSDNLQAVVNNANAGDTIWLGDGTYTGSGSDRDGPREVLTIDKDLTIRAA